MTHRLRIAALLISLTTSYLSGCATNPVTGGSDFVLMSEDQEIALGRKFNAEVLKEMPAYEDPELERLVQRVGARLAANSHRADLIYRFTVVDSKSVNAFALPGGYIYITRGLLAYLNSEAELAAVLGHEIGHVTARHSVRQHSTATVTGLLGAVLASATGVQGADTLTDLVGTAIVRGYGREHELEADRLGAEYLARSDYDPDAMLQVVGVLKDQETFEKAAAKKEGREPNTYHGLFATHPDNDARLQEVVHAAGKYKTASTVRTNRDSFLQALDGLTFGDGDKEGIVRDNHFYHKEMDFSLTFPEGWRIKNKPDKIIAHPPGNDGLIQLTVTDLNKRITPKTFMEQRLKLEDMRQGKTLTSDGMEGYTAIANGKTPYGTRAIRYIVLYRNDSAYIIAGAAKATRQSAKYDAEILATARSLRSLTATDMTLATAKKLAIIRAGQHTRYTSLAADSPIPNYPEEQLRLLNGDYPDNDPSPGQLLKIVR